MREAFHDQLDAIFVDLASMCAQVETAVNRATASLLTGDAAIAEEVISADQAIDAVREKVEDN
ncbi:MAG: PhoU domain-containing protein, partial [Nocardioides sp.]|uniref:PhoU domain-containing protein n=1 Tax=Nocardioides sp. TaxID=35761 RepID=UPI003263D450